MTHRRRLISLCLALVTAGGVVVALHSPAGGRAARDHAHVAVTRPHLIPHSVSFVSASTGWVWGPAAWPSAGRAEAGVLARTDDGGRTWRTVPLPPGIDFAQPQGGGVQAVSFLDRRHGYLYGSELWYTADGGGRWRRAAVTGTVLDIEGGFALVLPCTQALPCATGVLDRLAGPQLRTVLQARVSEYSSLAVRGSAVYLAQAGVPAGALAAPRTVLWASPDGGRSWTLRTTPCPSVPADAAAVAAWSSSGVALACGSVPGAGEQAKAFYASADGGRTWSRRASRSMSPGYVGSLAALDSRSWVFAAGRLPRLEVTHDGGRTWTAPSATAFSGEWWGPVSLAGADEVVAAPATLGGRALIFGRDGARHWRAVRFTPAP